VNAPRHQPPDRAPGGALAERAAALDWQALEELTHRDLGHRGLAAYRVGGKFLDRGQLRAAALEAAHRARGVAIVTGFCAILPDRVTAETDGPPGALFLAQVLDSLGIEVTLITDSPALALLSCGRDLLKLTRSELVEFPFDDSARTGTERWIDDFLARGRGASLTHLIAIERPAPSHGGEVCHNMHGDPIDGQTARTHRLLEAVRERKLPITTIGIGDGGNEIGMGSFARDDVAAAIGGDLAARIASRITTDFALIAGVSNWGAYALALAVGHLRGADLSSRWLQPEGQRELIETLVARAGAVDGRTLKAEPTVDGLAMDAFLQPLAEMHHIIERARSVSR
jgi:hypothetical protein